MTIQDKTWSTILPQLFCLADCWNTVSVFQGFYCSGSQEWSCWINNRAPVMEAHSCSIRQNILLYQCRFCVTHLHPVPHCDRENSERLQRKTFGEKTLNLPFMSGRIVITTDTICIAVCINMISRKSNKGLIQFQNHFRLKNSHRNRAYLSISGMLFTKDVWKFTTRSKTSEHDSKWQRFTEWTKTNILIWIIWLIILMTQTEFCQVHFICIFY